VSAPVLLFAGRVTFATTLLFGCGRAWQASRTDAGLALRLGDRSGHSGRRPLRAALIVTESRSRGVAGGRGLLLPQFCPASRD